MIQAHLKVHFTFGINVSPRNAHTPMKLIVIHTQANTLIPAGENVKMAIMLITAHEHKMIVVE